MAGIAVSFSNGNRLLPWIVLLLGAGLCGVTFVGLQSEFAFAGIALLAAIVWIFNKSDEMR